MSTKWKQALIGGCVHVIAWVLTYALIVALFKDSAARQAYGLLAGWWCALFIDYLFHVPFKAATCPFFAYICIGILAVFYQIPWIYHDLPSELTLAYITMLALGGIVFVSPIIIDNVISSFVKKLAMRKRDSSTDPRP
jgi:hypothetical protein